MRTVDRSNQSDLNDPNQSKVRTKSCSAASALTRSSTIRYAVTLTRAADAFRSTLETRVHHVSWQRDDEVHDGGTARNPLYHARVSVHPRRAPFDDGAGLPEPAH